jgi:hypothetical protein
MTFVSDVQPTGPLNGKTATHVSSTAGRWSPRHAHGVLPGLFLTSVVAAAAFAVRRLPGMATFSPMILSIVIGIFKI